MRGNGMMVTGERMMAHGRDQPSDGSPLGSRMTQREWVFSFEKGLTPKELVVLVVGLERVCLEKTSERRMDGHQDM